MSGIPYNPPNKIVPTFNPDDWRYGENISLTQADADARYLKLTGGTEKGAVNFNKTISVSGNTSLANVAVSGLTSTGSLSVSGLTSTGTLSVSGNTSLANVSTSGLTSTGTLSVSGNTSLANVSISGLTSTSTLSVSSNVSFANVSVSGATSSGTLSVGDITSTGVLSVSGNTSMANATSTGTITANVVNIISSSNTGGDSGVTLLKFSTPRPWEFKHTFADGNSELALIPAVGGKRFNIYCDPILTTPNIAFSSYSSSGLRNVLFQANTTTFNSNVSLGTSSSNVAINCVTTMAKTLSVSGTTTLANVNISGLTSTGTLAATGTSTLANVNTTNVYQSTPGLYIKTRTTNQVISNASWTIANAVVAASVDQGSSGIGYYSSNGVFENISGQTNTYHAVFTIDWQANSTNSREIGLVTDSTCTPASATLGYLAQPSSGGGGATTQTSSAYFIAAANSKFSIQIYQNSGGNLNLTGMYVYFQRL